LYSKQCCNDGGVTTALKPTRADLRLFMRKQTEREEKRKQKETVTIHNYTFGKRKGIFWERKREVWKASACYLREGKLGRAQRQDLIFFLGKESVIMHNLQICVLNCFSSMGSRNRILLKHVSILLVFFLSLSCCSTSETLTPSLLNLVVSNTTLLHRNFTALSEFRMINRRILSDCSASNPSLKVNVLSNSTLSDEEFVTVTVTGVSNPSDGDWVAMISPSNSE